MYIFNKCLVDKTYQLTLTVIFIYTRIKNFIKKSSSYTFTIYILLFQNIAHIFKRSPQFSLHFWIFFWRKRKLKSIILIPRVKCVKWLPIIKRRNTHPHSTIDDLRTHEVRHFTLPRVTSIPEMLLVRRIRTDWVRIPKSLRIVRGPLCLKFFCLPPFPFKRVYLSHFSFPFCVKLVNRS